MYEIIETVNLSKHFFDFWGRVKAKALDKINLKIYRGEIFGLLGPNGSGKTTTIKLLLGLLFPTSGSIKILGRSPRSVAHKKNLGFLPEETYLYPYQNAEEALFFYGRLFGLPRSLCRKRTDDLLEMVGLNHARRRPLKEFSKGMARRIGIATALINDPDVVFLDEPTTGLDPIGTREIKDLVLQLKQHGKTVFLCSHLLADVEDVCDKIAILYGGKIRCEGTVDELLRKKSSTQILLSQTPPGLLEELQAFFRQKGIEATMEEPRERLETFFLNTIKEARSAQLPTSGALEGKPAHFFSQSAPEQGKEIHPLLQQLVAPSLPSETIPESPSSEPTAEEKPIPVAQKILGALVQTPAPEAPEHATPQEKAPSPQQSSPKKEILQKLLKKGKKE